MRIGLNKEKSVVVAGKLNKYLADLHVLYAKLHNYHWNVVGLGFFEMHLKLEELYTATALEIDTIAERILQLEERPLASRKAYLETTKLILYSSYIRASTRRLGCLNEPHKNKEIVFICPLIPE